jgi:type IV secretion system protein VirB11
MPLADKHPLLARAAGPLLPYLENPAIREIRCTSAGRVFTIHSEEGKQRQPDVSPKVLDSFLSLIADLVGAEWRETSPCLHAAIPALGIRVQASTWPVSPGPCMTLRRHPHTVYPLPQWEAKGILTAREREALEAALFGRKTILIAGAVGSSKTSLLNALLHALQDSDERIVIVEDDPEILCEAQDCEFQRTVRNVGGQALITMRDLCRDLLRHSPDRVVVGEIRGGEALDAARAFQTGHPGLCTIHAASAESTLLRLEQLIQEVSVDPQRPLIAEAIDVIVHMTAYGRLWRATGILAVEGLDSEGTYITKPLI